MSIGLGIFLSALLVVAAWQIDKRGIWRPFFKVSVWVGGFVVAAAAAVGGIVWWEERSTELRQQRAIANESDQVVKGERQDYWGINLGMSREEVLYLKGEPSERKEEGEKNPRWGWQESHYVVWNKEGRVRGVLCSGDGLGSCESVAGIADGTFESKVIETLGQPAEPPKYTDDGSKQLIYGPPGRAQWLLSLEKGQVSYIYLYSPRAEET